MSERIGYIGLGIMGGGMARNLLKAGFDLTVWNAIAAPAATPRPVLERLETSLKTALADPDLRRRFAELAADMPQPDQIGAEPLRRLIASDIERFGPIISAVGVKVE